MGSSAAATNYDGEASNVIDPSSATRSSSLIIAP